MINVSLTVSPTKSPTLFVTSSPAKSSAKRWYVALLLPMTAMLCFASDDNQTPADQASIDRNARHQAADWQLMVPHLPDPTTATPAQLMTAADVMRARRMPEDALDYYQYALNRGGDESVLSNRIGITLLELHHPDLARIAFRRALKAKPKDAQAWNNLGATEYVAGSFRAAITDYLRAVKLDKKTAVYHTNLGTAYFETKDIESARRQFETALKLDRNVFQKSDLGGVEAHVLSPTDRGQFCMEMARLAIKQHDDQSVLRWLGKAIDAGFDIRNEMGSDHEFEQYRKDPRVATLIKNAKALKPGQLADSGPVPTLPADKPQP